MVEEGGPEVSTRKLLRMLLDSLTWILRFPLTEEEEEQEQVEVCSNLLTSSSTLTSGSGSVISAGNKSSHHLSNIANCKPRQFYLLQGALPVPLPASLPVRGWTRECRVPHPPCRSRRWFD